MAEEEWEVRGAHEAEVEDMAERRHPLGQAIALFSAVLATLGAIVSLFGGHTQNEALTYKNEAVLLKARASDLWAYYQAEDVKRHLAELGAATLPARADGYAHDAERYRRRGAALRAQAEAFDRRSDAGDAESRRALAPHGKLALAVTAIQIAIALASITALTGRRWLLWSAGLFALAGVLLASLAWV